MKLSEKGFELIKHFEGLRLHAYQCSANVWTIGYGHTAGVRLGDVINAEEADIFLHRDVADAERTVNNAVSVSINQHQFDALVSFVFNLGAGNFRSSVLLKKLNAGDYAGAAGELLRWVNAGGQKLAGLVRRREAEKMLFETPV
ncbi:lysozyme [Photorhabdus asymbiotica]|uniref:lysozyme n=1 Tax=Photorhabdus asymbiotica TaxID=291112 RepID=UPI003DA75BBF